MVDKILEFISNVSLIAFAISVLTVLFSIWNLYATQKLIRDLKTREKKIQDLLDNKKLVSKRILEYVGNVDVKEGSN